ncbi:MAG: hypothetical protein Q9223_005892, partial [Gallowayella weberi]
MAYRICNTAASQKMSPSRARTAVRSTANTPQGDQPDSVNDHQIVWTERVAHSRPRAPVRRFSASEEIDSRPDTAQLQQSGLRDNIHDPEDQKKHDNEVRFFGIPTPITQDTGDSELGNLGHAPYPSNIPDYTDGEASRGNRRYSKQPDVPFSEMLSDAFALHAQNQSNVRDEFGSHDASTDITPEKARSKLRIFQRRRTLILGHKAGLWLNSESFESFCGLANALVLHQWNDWGGAYKEVKSDALNKMDFFVEIKDAGKKVKQVKIRALTESGRREFGKHILPVLQKSDPKPLIRVHDGKLKYNFECSRRPGDKEPSCDNSRDLKVLAPDIGFLRVLADWHRWRERSKLVENSEVFEVAVFGLLFPNPDTKEFLVDLPDGTTFDVHRDGSPSLSAELQKAFSQITTRESQEGVEPKQIKLWARRATEPVVLERPPASPSQKSPGLARAEGTIFVHRPANFTHFRYDVPHTMEEFFELARKELYPETPGRLRLRISPSAAFRKEGKLLLQVTEPKDPYSKSDEHGETLEDVWKRQIVDNWFTPQEEVWAVKIFPEIWNTSALRSSASHGSNGERWNIPPESLMVDLAMISQKLLNIDPRKSEDGIVLHTKRGRPGEWLRWEASMSFNDFMLEILYKIDDDAIAIYPGDYEEPDDGTGLELEQSQAVNAMQEMNRKKTAIAKAAAEQMEVFKKPRSKLPPFNKRYNNLGHLGIQLPHTVWNPEGTHLDRAPSYAFNAPRYSASEVGLLTQRLMRAEEEILMREETCRVCNKMFLKRSDGKDLVKQVVP